MQFCLFYKVYNLVPPRSFTVLCNCQICLLLTFFITPRTKCEPWKVPPHSLPIFPLTLGNPFIYFLHLWVQFSSVESLSHVRLFETPWTAARQATLSITYSRRLLKLMSIESVMASNHLILCPFPPAFNLSQHQGLFKWVSFCIRWPKYWSFNFSILPMNIQDWFPLGWTGWIYLQSEGHSRVLQHQGSKASVFCHSAFFKSNSHPYMTTGKTAALTRWTLVGKLMSLFFNMLSRLVITFLPRNKNLLISWLQSPSTVLWSPRK